MISRRRLFTASAALLAAPSMVRAASLMPVSMPLRTLSLRTLPIWEGPYGFKFEVLYGTLPLNFMRMQAACDARSVPLNGRMARINGELIGGPLHNP